MNNFSRFTKLTEKGNLEEYKITNLKKTENEVLFLCNYQLKVTACVAYFVGQRLIAMKEFMGHGNFLNWIEEKFPLTERTARRYMFFYESLKSANFADLEGLTITEALRTAGIIEPKKPQENCIEGYNRIDLGGDPGQMKFDFEELFEMPSAINQKLQNYRTVGELVSEIVVVKRTANGEFISKRFAHFGEDIPQDTLLRASYIKMSKKTQAAIEDYLADLEQAEKN
jgi:hypothetical protein